MRHVMLRSFPPEYRVRRRSGRQQNKVLRRKWAEGRANHSIIG
jgi:hypothetical protein